MLSNTLHDRLVSIMAFQIINLHHIYRVFNHIRTCLSFSWREMFIFLLLGMKLIHRNTAMSHSAVSQA